MAFTASYPVPRNAPQPHSIGSVDLSPIPKLSMNFECEHSLKNQLYETQIPLSLQIQSALNKDRNKKMQNAAKQTEFFDTDLYNTSDWYNTVAKQNEQLLKLQEQIVQLLEKQEINNKKDLKAKMSCATQTDTNSTVDKIVMCTPEKMDANVQTDSEFLWSSTLNHSQSLHSVKTTSFHNLTNDNESDNYTKRSLDFPNCKSVSSSSVLNEVENEGHLSDSLCENIMNQINKFLGNSVEEQKDKLSLNVHEITKERMREYLGDSICISETAHHTPNKDYFSPIDEKQQYDSLFVPQMNYVSIMNNATDDSLNILTAKYLNPKIVRKKSPTLKCSKPINFNVKLDVGKKLPNNASDLTLYGISSSDISLDTRQYMERYGLLPSGSYKKDKLQNIKTSNILDMELLRQQPKLL